MISSLSMLKLKLFLFHGIFTKLYFLHFHPYYVKYVVIWVWSHFTVLGHEGSLCPSRLLHVYERIPQLWERLPLKCFIYLAVSLSQTLRFAFHSSAALGTGARYGWTGNPRCLMVGRKLINFMWIKKKKSLLTAWKSAESLSVHLVHSLAKVWLLHFFLNFFFLCLWVVFACIFSERHVVGPCWVPHVNAVWPKPDRCLRTHSWLPHTHTVNPTTVALQVETILALCQQAMPF